METKELLKKFDETKIKFDDAILSATYIKYEELAKNAYVWRFCTGIIQDKIEFIEAVEKIIKLKKAIEIKEHVFDDEFNNIDSYSLPIDDHMREGLRTSYKALTELYEISDVLLSKRNNKSERSTILDSLKSFTWFINEPFKNIKEEVSNAYYSLMSW